MVVTQELSCAGKFPADELQMIKKHTMTLTLTPTLAPTPLGSYIGNFPLDLIR